jgi:hypothetical protein
VPEGVIAQPSAPQFSSSQALIWVCRWLRPPGGTPILIRTGKRRSADVIMSRRGAGLAGGQPRSATVGGGAGLRYAAPKRLETSKSRVRERRIRRPILKRARDPGDADAVPG